MRKNVYLFISFILSLVILELGFYLISFLIPFDYYYKPPTLYQFREYLSRERNPHLGWDRAGEEQPTPEGYRFAPAGKNMSTPCISLYGDSFTWGDEVPPEAAWGNVLITLLGSRVDNYGVSGYGSDQAYLRFLYNKNDKAQIIILSHFSENIIRNINQDRSLIYGQGILLKPRFITDGNGHITLVPIPRLNIDDYYSYVMEPRCFLFAEYLLPETSALAKRRLSFPYSYRLPYMLTYKRVYMSLMSLWFYNVPPWFTELYDPRHQSHAYQVTRDIMINFVKECAIRGKIPIILFIPTIRDIKYYKATGIWIYGSLIDSLKQEGIQVYNLGPLLLKKVSSDDLCRYFCTNKKTQSGHYTVEGNRILAEVVSQILTQNPSYKVIFSMKK